MVVFFYCTFVVCPRVRVGPPNELLIYPREQADGRVGQTEPERLWLGGLLRKVAHAILEHILGNGCCLPLARREGRDKAFE